MIEIRSLKENYTRKYPNSPVSIILITQPDTITADSFLTLAKALLSVIKEE
jgi:hypothetical protein